MTVSRLERGQPVSADTAIRALSECGYALVVAPKFTRVVVNDASAACVSVGWFARGQDAESLGHIQSRWWARWQVSRD